MECVSSSDVILQKDVQQAEGNDLTIINTSTGGTLAKETEAGERHHSNNNIVEHARSSASQHVRLSTSIFIFPGALMAPGANLAGPMGTKGPLPHTYFNDYVGV